MMIRRSLAAVLLAGLAIALSAHAQTPGPNLTVAWVAPTQYTDGTPIAPGTPITYTLYAASCSSCPCASGVSWTAIATGLIATSSLRTAVTPTVHGYTVTATVAGVESDQATPACFDASAPATPPAAPKKPMAPTNVTITAAP